MAQTTARTPDTQAAAGDRMGRRDRRGLADREGFLAWAMLLPSIIFIALLVGLPLRLAVAFSFSDVTAGDPSFDWNGLANYRQIFDDPVFWQSLRNTIIFTAGSMVLIVVFGKVLANILVQDFHGKWIVRIPRSSARDHSGGAVCHRLAVDAGLDLQPHRLDAAPGRAD